MAAALSDTAIDIIKATVPALEAHGLAITKRMYERMFQDAEIRDLFNQSHHGESGSQPKALAAAIVAYARNIDNLGVLASRVERIAQKHVGLNIKAEHYPVVGASLLGAIKDVLGDAATDEIMAAWGDAYSLLADVLIAREKTIYEEHAAAPGGWTDWREFIVESTRPESDIIRSFRLRPADGGPVMRHRPGPVSDLRARTARARAAEAQLLDLIGPGRHVVPHHCQARGGARRPARDRVELAARQCGYGPQRLRLLLRQVNSTSTRKSNVRSF